MDIVFKHNFPQQFFDVKEIRAGALGVMMKYGNLALKDYEKFVGTWFEAPIFNRLQRYQGGDMEILITTDDDIFFYIDEGTDIRFATMVKGYQPKTAPRRIQSGAGSHHATRDGVAFISKWRPHPGIQPRLVSKTIKAKYKDKLEQEIRRSIIKNFKVAKGRMR